MRNFEYFQRGIRAPRIECNDGVSLSVQANWSAYSEPQDMNGVYTKVEIGFIKDSDGKPLACPDYLRPFADWIEEDMNYADVYAYVPVEILERFIADHGGRKFFTTFRPIESKQ